MIALVNLTNQHHDNWSLSLPTLRTFR